MEAAGNPQEISDALSAASRFFLQHRDLFEFDKYLGDVSVISSSQSLLRQYQDCERLHQRDVLQSLRPEPVLLTAISPYQFTPLSPPSNVSHSSPLHVAGPAASPPRRNHRPPDPAPLSPQHLANRFQLSVPAQVDHQRALRSPRRQPRSPTRYPTHAPDPSSASTHHIPKIDELLIDASTRTVHFGPAKRVDDAKKIELLIGSKCVGRVSAAASSNLPQAIRNRLLAATMLQQRRERLYTLLRQEYLGLVATT